jgi:hypothetical protein
MSENGLPILFQHDASRVVGRVEGDVATFSPDARITQQNMIDAGWQTLEAETVDGVVVITKAKLLYLNVGMPLDENT